MFERPGVREVVSALERNVLEWLVVLFQLANVLARIGRRRTLIDRPVNNENGDVDLLNLFNRVDRFEPEVEPRLEGYAAVGISQIVDSSGRVLATAPFPGYGEMISGRLPMVEKGALPLDRYFAYLCVLIAAICSIYLVFSAALKKFRLYRRSNKKSDNSV